MAITANDYQLTHKLQDGSGRNYFNTYYYRCVSGQPTSGLLLGAFNVAMVPLIEDILSISMLSRTLETINLVDTTDFGALSLSGVGNVLGDAQPSFLAVRYTLYPADRAFRSGGKRYGRLGEADCLGNAVAAGSLPRFQALADALLGEIVGGGVVFQLMIPKRVLVTNPDPPPAEIYELQDLGTISAVQFGTLTSQRSRL